jgi:hypothetical protein
MAEEKKEQGNIPKVSFVGVVEILAKKLSRKAAVIGLAMVLIYLLAATPNVAGVTGFIVAIALLAGFFTTLQWIIDIKGDSKKKKKKKGGDVADGGADDK